MQARLADAFNHLELEELGFDYYIQLISQAMIKEICYEATRPGMIGYEFYDNRQHDYCKVLNFLHELKTIAADAQKEGARRAADAQHGR